MVKLIKGPHDGEEGEGEPHVQVLKDPSASHLVAVHVGVAK